MTVTLNDREITRTLARLVEAQEELVAAEAAYILALSTDGPHAAEAADLTAAQLHKDRALLAAKLANFTVAPGTKRIVTIDRWTGDHWTPMRWGTRDARPGETASAQALRHAAENDLLTSADAWRVLVWTDPAPDADPDGEWNSPAVSAATGRCADCGARNPFGTPCHAEQPILHDGFAVGERGLSLRGQEGVVLFNQSALEVGAWNCAGVGYSLDIPAGDHARALRWAAEQLADRGRTVTSWQHHRDSYGQFWLPTIAGSQS